MIDHLGVTVARCFLTAGIILWLFSLFSIKRYFEKQSKEFDESWKKYQDEQGTDLGQGNKDKDKDL